MSEMVDRAARAIAIARGRNPDYASVFSDGPCWKDYRVEAEAAIAALREPTKAMCRAAAHVMSPTNKPDEWVSNREKHKLRFQAMIDAALSTTPADR